ncbi:aliphatic sulfonates ABC transporter ATP-binding protein [Dickeya dadantii]|uniref:aliphatic sulfonates ABC transporter ATP-binding protein n=1 Tax=Dickeya dadantii TaxID=204038 RepID=UPI001CF4EC76|nr:aliphatic sulfonates ABC transporter ATP-binding protein [Dickeya dadantii]MCA7012860.1 aliphatic sulfonates ABC transporter ATP-binding protein [Dickeya dadantii]
MTFNHAAPNTVAPARLNAGTPLLINGVTKRYGQRTILNDVHLHIPAGQFVAVVGRSGCGKSTLLRLLAGLEQTSHGELLAGRAPLRQARDDIRLMFQEARLLPWKRVLDNVGLGLRGEWRTAAHQALDAVGLSSRAADWPAALSGGQKQRVALARALIHRPGLLLLDEPLGALDALTRIEMQGLIESLWLQQGFTVLLVTHDVSEAVALADRVILIEEGRVGLDVAIDLPRPRRRGSARLAELEAQVLERILTPSANSTIADIRSSEPQRVGW